MEKKHCTIIQKGTGLVVGHLKGKDLIINRDTFSDNELEATLVDVDDHKCIYCKGSVNYKIYKHLYSILESVKSTASEEFIDEIMEKMDDIWWSMSETEQDKFDSERYAGQHGGVDHATIGEDNDLAR